MIIAVLLNIVLDIYLVPKYGGVGAAIATSISFFVWNIVTLILSERFWPIHYPIGIFCLQISVGVAGCWRILFVYQNNLPVWHAGIAMLIVSIVLIFASVKYDQLIEFFQYIKIKLVGNNQ